MAISPHIGGKDMTSDRIAEIKARLKSSPAGFSNVRHGDAMDLLGALETSEARVKVLEAALAPFSEFAPSLLEWHYPDGFTIRNPHPEHLPVIRKTYPLNDDRMKICNLWVSDFRTARAAKETS